MKVTNPKNLSKMSPFYSSSFSLGQSPNMKSFGLNYNYQTRKDSSIDNYQKFFTANYDTMDNSRSYSNTNLLNMSTKSNSLATNKHSPFSKNICDSDNKQKISFIVKRESSSSSEKDIDEHNEKNRKENNSRFKGNMNYSNITNSNNNVISNFSTRRPTRQAAINANISLKQKRKSSSNFYETSYKNDMTNNNNLCELSREYSFKNEVTNLSGSDKNCNSRLLLQELIKQDGNTRISRHSKPSIEVKSTKQSISNNLPLGLKEISNKVKKIIKDRRVTSYKEISDNIVQELDVISSQDSKNIRRRIYDALNVIKALGLFTNNPQDTKSIVWNSDVNQAEINEDLKQKITEEEKIIAAKKEISEEIRLKSEIYRSLIIKNKARDVYVKAEEKIRPPFIVMSSATSLMDQVNLVFEECKKKIHISSSYPLNIRGDLDIITRIFSS